MRKHDYGLDKKNQLTIKGEQWKLIPYKKVVMCNVKLCKNRITVDKIVNLLKGWGFPELELAEAIWLTEAVVEAINSNKPTADISRMFNIQVALYDEFGYAGILTKEAIAEKLYEKINENNEQIIVKLKWRCLL